MPPAADTNRTNRFLVRVMQVERQYSHRFKGVRNQRRDRIRAVLEEHEFQTRSQTKTEQLGQ